MGKPFSRPVTHMQRSNDNSVTVQTKHGGEYIGEDFFLKYKSPMS